MLHIEYSSNAERERERHTYVYMHTCIHTQAETHAHMRNKL